MLVAQKFACPPQLGFSSQIDRTLFVSGRHSEVARVASETSVKAVVATWVRASCCQLPTE
jgi:hypothetical protein